MKSAVRMLPLHKYEKRSSREFDIKALPNLTKVPLISRFQVFLW